MTSFRYKALSSSGKIIRGLLDAPSDTAALQQVRSLGHFPISATEGVNHFWRQLFPARIAASRRISARALAIATHEFAVLVEAGLEIDTAFEMIINMSEARSLAATFKNVQGGLRAGASLGDALAAQQAFPGFYISLVRSGEWSGNLAQVLKTLAQYLERAQANRDAIASALTYPIILLVTAGLSIAFLLLFVLPEFQSVFESAGARLPFATHVVVYLGDLLRNFWWAILLFVASAILACREALKNPSVRLQTDRMLLRIPVIGELLLKIECERFCRTLGILLQGGIVISEALPLAQATFANNVLSRAISETAIKLKEGESMASRIQSFRLFPPTMTDIIRVGETTATLDKMLLHQADIFDQASKHTTDRLLTLLTPALTLLLGILVGGLIASILVAILSINDLAL